MSDQGISESPLAYRAKDGMPIWAYAEDDGRPVCGHRTKYRGDVCQAVPFPPTGRCKHHDGGTIVFYKRGRAYIRRLAARIEEHYSDPELVSARGAVATYEALIEETLNSLDERSSSEMWGVAKMSLADLEDALSDVELPEDASRALRSLSRVFAEADGERLKEQRARTLMAEQLAHKKHEVDRLKALDAFVTARDAVSLFGIIADGTRKAVDTHVKDPSERALVLRHLQAVIAKSLPEHFAGGLGPEGREMPVAE